MTEEATMNELGEENTDAPAPDVTDTATPNSSRETNQSFSARIGEALVLEKNAASVVAAIEGPWGYGKSTVLQAVADYLHNREESDSPIVANFNPWHVDPALSFAPAFFNAFANTMRDAVASELGEQAAQAVTEYAKSFVAQKQRSSYDSWSGPASRPQGATSEIDNANDKSDAVLVRQRFVVTLARMNRPIVVIIDDLDRLPPRDVFEMIRLIHHITELPRTSVLMAFDPAYIEDALQAQGVSDARLYIDRFVQVRLPLPAFGLGDMTRLIEAELQRFPDEAIQGRFPDGVARLTELYQGVLRYLIRSPRQVKQVFDRVRFSEKAARGEVAFAELLGIETIAVVAPHIYDQIRSSPEIYTGMTVGEAATEEEAELLVKNFSGTRGKLLDELSIEDRKHVEKLVGMLFPLTNPSAMRSSPEFYLSHGRIAAIKCLLNAISFGLPREAVALPVVKEFITCDDNRRVILKDLLNSGEIDRFLIQLRAVVDDLEVANPDDFVSVLAVVACSTKLARPEKGGRFDPGIVMQVWWAIEAFLAPLDRNKRLRYLGMLMSNRATLAIATEALTFCLRQMGLLDSNEKVRADAAWCKPQELEKLQSMWVKTVTAIFSSSSFVSLQGKRGMFDLLSRIDPEEAKRQVDNLMQLEEDLDSLVLALGEVATDQKRGPYCYVPPELLERLGGVERIRSRVKERLYSGPPIEADLAAIYDAIQSGERVYLNSR